MDTIVVGIDGSEQSLPALRLALDEARFRGTTLTVVLAWSPPPSGRTLMDQDLRDHERDLDAAALAEITRCVDLVGGADVKLQPVTYHTDAASALLREASGADLLVVGSRGGGGFKGLRLGSVSQKCVTHALCPVVVVPTGREAAADDEADAGAAAAHHLLPTRIVVGIDGSAPAISAARWACAEAAIRELPVTAVMVWSYLDQHHAEDTAGFDPTYREETALAALQEELARVGVPSGVDMTPQVVLDLPTAGLLSAVSASDLLVVGNRGRGSFASLTLGSTSLQCVTHAPCPVVVVR